VSDYRFTDETATVFVLHGLVRDMRHLLEWLTIGLGCLALAKFIRLLGSVADHQWTWAGWDALMTVVFAASAIGTAKRAAKYRTTPAETTEAGR
jgi:hypothetical protein